MTASDKGLRQGRRFVHGRRFCGATEPERVGLLVTHGMGVQHEGEALSDVGDPLLSWASSWLESRHGSAVTWPSKTERSMPCPYPDCGKVDGPLHVHATWTLADTTEKDGPGTTVNVVIAESWWANEFKAPSAARLSDWLPSLIWGVTWRGVLWCTLFLAAIVFSVACIEGDWTSALFPAAATATLTALLAVLAAPAVLLAGKLPFLTDKTKSLLDFLTLWVGDVLIYEKYPVSAANARKKIREDLQWLVEASGSKRTVLAAHSLGSLLAVDVLAAKSGPAVNALVTFGSPIRLLERRLHRYVESFDVACPPIAWLNVYDKMDFIAGPVDYDDDFPVNLSVDNGQSIIRAHGAYPDNAEQFLTALYRLVLGHDNHSRDNELTNAMKFRRRRSWIRHILIAATAPALMGVTLLLLKAGWPQILSDAVTGKKFVPEWTEGIIRTAVPSKDSSDLTSAVILCLGTAGALILFLLWTVRLVFEWWEYRSEDVLSSGFKPARPLWVGLIATVLLAAVVVPPLIPATVISHAQRIDTGAGFLFEAGPAGAALLIALSIGGVRKVRHIKTQGSGTPTAFRATPHANPLDKLGPAFGSIRHKNHEPRSRKQARPRV